MNERETLAKLLTDDFASERGYIRMSVDKLTDRLIAAGVILDAARAGDGLLPCHCGKPWSDHDVHYPDVESDR